MKLITRDELRIRMERGDGLKLVMTMPEQAYSAKHLPHSVCAPSTEDALELLEPADEIVIYCSDVYCAASIYAYRALERRGYTNLRRYAGGIADWEAAGYPLESGPTAEIQDHAVAESRRGRTATRRRRCLTPAFA
jgi:rhodanese-related sulfurtransferase